VLHTIGVLVENRPGMLNRIISLWRQRMYNIESLSVGHSETLGISRMTFTVDGMATDVEQVVKQVRKIIGVYAVADLTNHNVVHREIALVKAATHGAQQRSQMIEIAKIFRAEIIDISQNSLVLQVTGEEEKVDAFVSNLDPFGIIEVVRTGRLSMTRGPDAPLHKAAEIRTPVRRQTVDGGAPKGGSLM